MQLKFVNEFEIDSTTSKAINHLLQRSFSDIEYFGRDYFKQLPHYRILATKGEKLIGQLGIDYRVMNLNGTAIKVFGVVGLCVDVDFRGNGIGKSMMLEFERIAKENKDRIDFLFLVTDDPLFYEKLGFRKTRIETTWLKIDQHLNLGVGVDSITDAHFMYKSVSGKKWEDGHLDLLGYMY